MDKQTKKQIIKDWKNQNQNSPSFIKERSEFINAIVRVKESDIKMALGKVSIS